jgi:hypothetical protein
MPFCHPISSRRGTSGKIETISQIPPHAQQDYRAIKMPALEHRVLHYWDRDLSS